MNTGTAISTYIFGFVVVILIGVAIRRMLHGWRGRAQRQTELIGTLPTMPDLVGSAVIAPTRGLYVGSTLAPNWLERVAAGDLGYRSKAVLTRYPEGILLERSGASPIWIPEESLIGVRAERALAGKVIPGARTGTEAPGGILVLRWRLPSGTEIDTGFRGDDRPPTPEELDARTLADLDRIVRERAAASLYLQLRPLTASVSVRTLVRACACVLRVRRLYVVLLA